MPSYPHLTLSGSLHHGDGVGLANVGAEAAAEALEGIDVCHLGGRAEAEGVELAAAGAEGAAVAAVGVHVRHVVALPERLYAPVLGSSDTSAVGIVAVADATQVWCPEGVHAVD